MSWNKEQLLDYVAANFTQEEEEYLEMPHPETTYDIIQFVN